MVKVHCSNNCGFEDEYEPTEVGMDYYEAIGTCPGCNTPMLNEQGRPTAVAVEFQIVDVE